MNAQTSPGFFVDLRERVRERAYRWIADRYDIAGFKRIYLVHIRKTGGTSLNYMFLSLSRSNPHTLYGKLHRAPDRRLMRMGKIFVEGTRKLINEGHYFYAFSHIPLHGLRLPEGTFTVTCLRDPVKRVVSLYNMLMYYSVKNVPHPGMARDGRLLGNSFEDFIERIPQEDLLNQLHMFSERLNVEEAAERIKSLPHFFMTEKFEEGVKDLNAKTGLHLKYIHTRNAPYQADISDDSILRLREKLEKEYELLERLRAS